MCLVPEINIQKHLFLATICKNDKALNTLKQNKNPQFLGLYDLNNISRNLEITQL